MQGATGIRFVMEKEECFSYKVEYEGDTLHISFVVIKSDSPWHFSEDGVDLVVCSVYSLNLLLTHTDIYIYSLDYV